MAQQLGFVLTAFPDFLKATFRVAAHRKDIVGSCKHVDLSQAEFAVDDLEMCSTAKRESPYSSIFGRWWP